MNAGWAEHARRPAQSEHAETPVTEFVSMARDLFDLKTSAWEDPVWDVTSWCRNRNKTARWRFLTDNDIPFERSFVEVVKAAFVYQARVNGMSPKTLINWMVPIRALHEVLWRGSGGSGSPVDWNELTLRDWRLAEEEMIKRLSPNSRYAYAQGLQGFVTLLEVRGVVPRVRYSHRQSRPRDSSTRHVEDRDRAANKLPPTGALHALADAAQNPKDDLDRMLFDICKLLVSLGFRVNEALTLPADCWRTNENGRHYLTYWPEKGGPLSPKWIPSTAAELVKEAVETLLSLTAEARHRARLGGQP